MAFEFIVSPLNEVLYGTDFEIDGKRVPIRKNVEVLDQDDSKKNVIHRLIDRLMLENERKRTGHEFEPETSDELYDTIKGNVLACKMFASRHIGRCYLTNNTYEEDCKELHGHVFDGAETALGSRWFFSALPYHESAQWLLPFADLCFNFGEYMVPVRDFPNIAEHSDGKNYIVVNVPRTKGPVQRGFIKVGKKSMVVYRAIENRAFIHPAYVSAGTKIQPIVTTYFMHNGSDIEFNSLSAEYPFTDCTKDFPVEELVKHNPELSDAFRIGDQQFAGFHDAFHASVINFVEWM